MRKSIFFFVAFCLIQVPLFSQSYAYKVLVNKGKNEFKSTTGWQQLKVGSSLAVEDEIKVGSNSYVGLVHTSGQPIELKEAKTYKVADLKLATGSSVVTKYTNFILSSNNKKGSNIGATGAVDRGSKEIDVYLPTGSPQYSVFFNPKQTISWDNSEFKGPFTVKFTSLFDDQLKTIETTGTSVTIDFDSPEFANEDNIIVQVVMKGENKDNGRISIKRLSKQDKARVQELLKDASSASEETALGKYILAAFYEDNKLLIDAATQYADAIRLAPDVTSYQEEFDQFLQRTALKNPPTK